MENNAFLHELHAQYIHRVSQDTGAFEYLVTEHLRMSGVYWGLTAAALLGASAEELRADHKLRVGDQPLGDWVLSCQHECGGFSGNVGHDPHMLYTLSALQILALIDELQRVDKDKIAQWVISLQQADGSFFGDKWGEIDTRFSYCAISCLSILGKKEEYRSEIDKAAEFVLRCRNFDGGFGAVPGAESHAGQIFCCVGALSIAGDDFLRRCDVDLLGWWLSERQCDSGGLNGRPEKQADVCYSWWILSSMGILGRINWIDKDKLVDFIVKCQDADDGGIADRPGNMADIFHTFFGVAGLSLLGYLVKISENAEVPRSYRFIDPVYALPADLVQSLGLTAAVLPEVSC